MAEHCQRWRERRATYRPARETIRPSEFDVARMDDDATPRAFVERHHYSASYPAARERFGLYHRGQLAGVAVFSHPANDKVLTNTFATLAPLDAVELGRLVLLDEIGANAESYFVARCFEQLRAGGYRGVVSFSDPIERTSITGATVMPGHVGTVYQALNARYLGLGTRRTLYILPDGTNLSARTLQKVRGAERGWLGAVVSLVERFSVEPLDAGADRDARMDWLRRAVMPLTRKLQHPGNHKYVWTLDRRVQLAGGSTLYSYPKKITPGQLALAL